MQRVVLVFLVLLIVALPAAAEEEGDFGSPTGAVLDVGSQEGFGLGSILPDPTALEGANRARVVLPGSISLSTLALTGRYATFPAPNQRLMLDMDLDPSLLNFDLGYSLRPEGSEGMISANLLALRSRMQAFEGGPIGVGLPGGGDHPWLYRNGGGVEWSQPVAEDLKIATALTYSQISAHSGPFTGSVAPFDELGFPLLVNPRGRDDLLAFRFVGLRTDLDHLQYPSEGNKLRFGVDQSVPVGAAQIGMTRFATNLTGFIPAPLFGFAEGPRTLVLNLQAGSILGLAPPYEAFNLGGPDSVRGWGLGELGTGKSFLQTTAEYRFPLGKVAPMGMEIGLRGTVFVDYATDFGSASQVFGRPAVIRGKPGSGAGFGVGLQGVSPIGLIRLESGWNGRGGSELYLSVGDRF